MAEYHRIQDGGGFVKGNFPVFCRKERADVKMTPLEKQSKKSKKAYYAERRGSWNGLSPVTRVSPGGTEYDRRRERKALCRKAAQKTAGGEKS